jgi:hypothetical protein
MVRWFDGWRGSEGQGSPLVLLLLDGQLRLGREPQNDSVASCESLYGCGVKRAGSQGRLIIARLLRVFYRTMVR